MKKLVLTSVPFVLLLIACTLEHSAIPSESSMNVLAEGEILPVCDATRFGDMFYVTDSTAVYYCANKKWSKLDGADGDVGNSLDGAPGTSCSAKETDAGIEVSCGDKVVGTIKDGTAGMSAYELAQLAGFKGTEAEWLASLKGDNCIADAYTDKSTGKTGYKLTCGGENKGAIWNGADGNDCVVAGKGSVVTITCGDSKSSFDLLKFVSSSSSDVETSSSSVASSSSSSVTMSSSGMKQSIPYTTECPAGHTCTYAPTEYLNPNVTYGEFLDERDYQVYKTVEICDENKAKCQIWMAQNLNYAYTGVKFSFSLGAIVNESDSTSWCYKDKADSCAKYGRLYTWSAAMDSIGIVDANGAGVGCGYGETCNAASSETSARVQGACPSGWHLPSVEEWNDLFAMVGGISNASTKLKSSSGWDRSEIYTDTFGFSVLPASCYYGNYGSYGSSDHAYFWSSIENGIRENNTRNAYGLDLGSGDGVYLDYLDKYIARSVRCIKD